jgi:hypothetical protein
LIDDVARGLGLQVFTEDSQLGLLKQSLAIAGSCFVIDIDLETDAVPDEPLQAGTAAGSAVSATGKVRLSKLEVNHVTADGGNEASPHVGRVLEALVGSYIEARYAEASGHKQERERGKRVQGCINKLKEALGEVKELDGKTGQDNMFAALEKAAPRVQALVDSKRYVILLMELISGLNLCPSRVYSPHSPFDPPQLSFASDLQSQRVNGYWNRLRRCP